MTDLSHEHDNQAEPEEQKERKGLSRRRLLAGGAGATAAYFLAHATGDFSLISNAAAEGRGSPRQGNRPNVQDTGEFNDDPIDPQEAVDNWFPSPYGDGDELGTLNEVTPHKTMDALHSIRHNPAMPPKMYNLGEILEEGVPAFPGRFYSQTRVGPDAPAGTNELIGMEERFETTYQIATQLDGLPHIGIRDQFYNGFTVADLTDGQSYGANFLGQEKVPPIVTRGVLLDVLGLKLEQGDSDALGDPVDGEPILGNSYRITVEDLEAAMEFSGVSSIEPGDAVLIHTGWSKLFTAEDSPDGEAKRARYLATEPGPFLREARWIAQFRPALFGSDTWALEVLPTLIEAQPFPVHQELLTHHGIRIGEAMNTEEMVEDGVGEFVFFYTGQRPKGGTAANVAPGAIAQQLGRGRRRGR